MEAHDGIATKFLVWSRAHTADEARSALLVWLAGKCVLGSAEQRKGERLPRPVLHPLSRTTTLERDRNMLSVEVLLAEAEAEAEAGAGAGVGARADAEEDAAARSKRRALARWFERGFEDAETWYEARKRLCAQLAFHSLSTMLDPALRGYAWEVLLGREAEFVMVGFLRGDDADDADGSRRARTETDKAAAPPFRLTPNLVELVGRTAVWGRFAAKLARLSLVVLGRAEVRAALLTVLQAEAGAASLPAPADRLATWVEAEAAGSACASDPPVVVTDLVQAALDGARACADAVWRRGW